MNDDAPEVDSFSHKCYQALSSPRFWGQSLGTKLGQVWASNAEQHCLTSPVRLHQIIAVSLGTHHSYRKGWRETNYIMHVSSTAGIKSGCLLMIVFCQAIWSTIPRVWICNIDLTYTSSIGVRTWKSPHMLKYTAFNLDTQFLKEVPIATDW